MKEWMILVSGPAGYERKEFFMGETLENALEKAREHGFAWVSDEDGNPISWEVVK